MKDLSGEKTLCNLCEAEMDKQITKSADICRVCLSKEWFPIDEFLIPEGEVFDAFGIEVNPITGIISGKRYANCYAFRYANGTKQDLHVTFGSSANNLNNATHWRLPPPIPDDLEDHVKEKPVY
jgi:hypothetical protein